MQHAIIELKRSEQREHLDSQDISQSGAFWWAVLQIDPKKERKTQPN